VIQNRPKPDPLFSQQTESLLQLLSTSCPRSPYFSEATGLRSHIIVFSSDEGFMGELATLVVNAAVDMQKFFGTDATFTVIGERGLRYLEEFCGGEHAVLHGISDEVAFSEAKAIALHALIGFPNTYGRVCVVYPEFISLTQHRVVRRVLFPFEPAKDAVAPHMPVGDMLCEPSDERVIARTAALWAASTLWDICFSAKQAEFAARIMHLEGSTQELTQVNRKLKQTYFKHVNAANDKSIREISASKMLLKK
jgi:F0F1-type ATP synthase gamma subunit